MTSGPNIPDARRGTERLTLRAAPALVARLRDLSVRHGVTLAQVIEAALDLADERALARALGRRP